jgi:hypothetical protein
MSGHWKWSSPHGTFRIVPQRGRFHVFLNDESLDSYDSPEHALDELIGGRTSAPLNGIDAAKCGLPGDLSEWHFVKTKRGEFR